MFVRVVENHFSFGRNRIQALLPERQKTMIALQKANFSISGKSGKNQCKVQAYIYL
jgi:hypothetical protein